MGTRFNCNQCNDKPELVRHVRACSICQNDRTANEIPFETPLDTPLIKVIELKPGLSNRFTPMAEAPAPVDPAPLTSNPKAEVDRQLDRVTKKRVKNKARRVKQRVKAKAKRRR